MTTETQPLPADAEIKDLYAQETGFILDDSPAALLDFARAVLAKWGTPAPVGVEPVGEVGSMPGTDGFTMACFKASDVPIGTKLYTTPQPTHAVPPAELEPLTDWEIESATGTKIGTPFFLVAKGIVQATESAHGITKGGQHGAE